MTEKKLIMYPFIGLVIGQIESNSSDLNEDISEIWKKTIASFNATDLQVINPGIAGGEPLKVKRHKSYLKEFTKLFQELISEKYSVDLSLRFTERMKVHSVVSDRGVFKTIINKGKENERIFFGYFNALLQKEDDVWRITLDYDLKMEDLIAEMKFNTIKAMESQEMSLPC